MARFGNFDQYLDNAGDPLAEGKLYFYESGTTTPKTTYSDVNNSIPNTNPVLLSAAGRQPNIFFEGVAKVILTDNNDVQIAVRDPVGETGTDFGDEWVASKIYSANDVVLGSDGIYYRSLSNGNQNNNPVTSSGFWTLLYSVEWNSGITYSVGDVVTYGSQQYQSLQNSNLNQNPSSATSYWVSLAFAWLSTATYSEDQNVVGTDGILYTSLQDSNTGNDPATSPAYWVGTSAAAAASAVAAAASATAASDSETAAAASETAAAASETAAAASETAAAASESAAATSATNASNSATAAATSETNAAASETAAAASASAASTSETNAAASASAASTSETNAAASETAAAASETAAAASESAAATSETNAANSASAASTSASNASTSETNAASSATAAAGSATAAAGSATAAAGSATDAADKYDEFDDRYLGEKASDPTLDNDGNALITGALYFNTSTTAMKVYTGSVWQDVAPVATSVTLSQVTDFPSQSGQSGKYLSTNGTVPSWETLTTDPTLGTLTKTFRANEIVEIPISSSVVAPVVSVTKEVPQIGITNNQWEANASSYEIENSAYNTSLSFEGFDISKASFVDSFSVSAEETTPTGIAFNTDGTKMFVVGQNGDDVNEYTLSTGFDVSTATYSQNFSVSAQELTPDGIAFNTDGTKMFIVGQSGDDVNEYVLSVGFDVSTASFVDSFSVADTAPTDIAFNTDGTKMFVVGDTGNQVLAYALSTGFDVSTASFSTSLSLVGQDSAPQGIAFNNNGTIMFIVGDAGNDINQYILSTTFDISTASYYKNFSVLTEDSSPQAIAFNTDGTKMFVVGNIGNDVNEYSLGVGSLVLGTGLFSSEDVGKIINVNNGELVLVNTAGIYNESTAPTSYDTAASGDWSMIAVFYSQGQGLRMPSPLMFKKNFSVVAQDTDPQAIAFNNDGTKMFILGNAGNDVNEYTLSTAFDISTASFVDSFSVGAQETVPNGIAFSSSGTKMFVVGGSGDDVNEYTLSTAFDVSTASFVDSFSVASQETNPQGVAFNTTGTKMFITGTSGDDVNEYTLSTGFDVSTASFVDSFSVISETSVPTDIAFNNDGTKMFVLESSGVNEYLLSTGFDVSTASFIGFYSTASEETGASGITLSADNTKMFIVGNSGDDVNEYDITPTPVGYQPCISYNINTTYWTDINSLTTSNTINNGNVFYAISNDNRDSWSVVSNVNGARDIVKNNAGTWQYNSNATYASETWTNASTNTEAVALREAMEGASFTDNYNLSVASFVNNFSVSTEETSPYGIAFNTNGTKMFVVGLSGDDVNEYNLSTGFDVSTASFVDSFSVATEETIPTGLAFNTDGTKMFVVGQSGDDVNEYTLSTGFDVSTASFVDSFSVASEVTSPYGITFSTDGTKMFVGGSTNVYEYNLATAFDVSTASYSKSLLLSEEGITLRGIAFNSDGTKMFIVDNSNKVINEYTLSTGFDVATALFFDNFSTAAQTTSSTGITFNADGTKMFIVGNNTSGILEYTTTGLRYTNQITSNQLNNISDANQIALGNDLDFAVILYLEEGASPVYTGTVIDYDANILNQGALLGTDYTFDYPSDNEVRINSINAGNYKVRIM